MDEKKYGGFRFDGNKAMKGTKAIGKKIGDTFKQQKPLRFFLRKYKGFGVSLGLLYLLLDNGVLNYTVEVTQFRESKKKVIGVAKASVQEIINSEKIQFPGYDEQRLLKWIPEGSNKSRDKSKKRSDN